MLGLYNVRVDAYGGVMGDPNLRREFLEDYVESRHDMRHYKTELRRCVSSGPYIRGSSFLYPFLSLYPLSSSPYLSDPLSPPLLTPLLLSQSPPLPSSLFLHGLSFWMGLCTVARGHSRGTLGLSIWGDSHSGEWGGLQAVPLHVGSYS